MNTRLMSRWVLLLAFLVTLIWVQGGNSFSNIARAGGGMSGFVVWSPDGSQIFYSCDIGTCVADASGNEVHPSFMDNCPSLPRWSPDGTRAYLNCRSGRNDFIVDADGNSQGFGCFYFAAWSPDSTQIALTWDQNCSFPPEEIYISETDGSNLRNLTNNSADDGFRGLSPDRTQIAFHSDRDGVVNLYVMDTDGDNLHNLTEAIGGIETYEFSGWRPGSTQIVFSKRNNDGTYLVYLVDADGSNLRPLAHFGEIIGFYGVAWSRDGGVIAISPATGTSSGELYTIEIESSNLRKITEYGVFPAWSPDGQRLAFFSDCCPSNIEVIRMSEINTLPTATPQS